MGPFKGKLRVAQRDWKTANPGKVITIHDPASLTNVAYEASFTAKNITAAFAKPGIWAFSILAFGAEDFQPSLVAPTDKELPAQEISVPSASTPAARDISRPSKDSLPPHVRPFPKPGPRCERKQRKKVKSDILTDSLIKIALNKKHLQAQLRRRNTARGATIIELKMAEGCYKKPTLSSSSECN
jgi:hypothetical protein